MSGWIRSCVLGGLLCLGVLPAGASESGSDLIHVFYPRSACLGDEIDLEVWDRGRSSWLPHAVHPRVPVESCQLEDAGLLLHEIRWRCNEPGHATPWNVGLDVFDPAISESCAVGALESPEPRADIHVSAPFQGAVVRWEREYAVVEGSVRVDGIEGVEYDVVLALDRSGSGERAEARLAAAVRAARSFVTSLRPRLGDVRVGVVAFPTPQGVRGASVVLLPSVDARRIDRALAALGNRGVAGGSAFLDGLGQALDLAAPPDVARARPRARPVVIMAADGGAAPFSPQDSVPSYEVRLLELAERAREAGARIHLFGLAGVAQQASPLVRQFAALAHGSSRRVPVGAFGNAFFNAVRLVVPREVRIENPRTHRITRATLDSRGRFRANVPVQSGVNPLRIVATTTARTHAERHWTVRFDASRARELVLAGERERIRRTRSRKQLDLSVEEDGAGAQHREIPTTPGAAID